MVKTISQKFDKLQNIRTNIYVSMFLEDNEIKKVDEEGLEDLREIDIEKTEEFGFFDCNDRTEIGFSFGTIKIDKTDFKEALRRYLKISKLIKKLNKR